MNCDHGASVYDCTDCLRAEVTALATKVKNAAGFLDVHVRAMLPNEHGNCAIDSGCSHGAWERENFEALDKFVEYLRGGDAQSTDAPVEQATSATCTRARSDAAPCGAYFMSLGGVFECQEPRDHEGPCGAATPKNTGESSH